MKIEGTINVSFEDLVTALKSSTLSNTQKVKLAKEISLAQLIWTILRNCLLWRRTCV